MTPLDLVMPMAGRGSRFARLGIREPKPLIQLSGRPFFWWAVESIRRAAPLGDMVFVVLQEHIAEWQIDRRIQEFYPTARIVAIPEVTSGAAETGFLGAGALTGNNPIAINDCDHAFVAPSMSSTLEDLAQGTAAGTLMTFRSESPNYSYVQLDRQGKVTGTVEKQVVSPFAITGCYLFRNTALFQSLYHQYAAGCPYAELFLSGVYNTALAAAQPISQVVLEKHFAFGTPDEFGAVEPRLTRELAHWLQPPSSQPPDTETLRTQPK